MLSAFMCMYLIYVGALLCMHGPLPCLPATTNLNAPDTNVGVWGVVHML